MVQFLIVAVIALILIAGAMALGGVLLVAYSDPLDILPYEDGEGA